MLFLFALACSLPGPAPMPTPEGAWTAWLDSPGGDLRFGLVASDTEITLVNGEERIAFSRLVTEGPTTTVHLDPYDATLSFTLSADGTRLDGHWNKQKRGSTDHLEMHATRGNTLPANTTTEPVIGRWAVDFSSDELGALGLFDADERASGTFLTTTGDYRFLAGNQQGKVLELSCFDGSHAFLFRATRDGDTLAGDFWSGGTWHETWTAKREDRATLPDGFSLSAVVDAPRLATLAFPNLEGVDTPVLGESKATVVTLFGSWCPNCNDEAPVLQALHDRYASKGLRVVGLAFEHGNNFARDAAFVKRFAARHGVSFPLLVAGSSDKDAATATFGVLDQVRAFPTTLFVKDGEIQAVHTGFVGPADGSGHAALLRSWDARVEALLAP